MSFDKDKISILNKDITSWLQPRSEGDFQNNKNYNFTSVEDGNPIVKTYNNFTILPETVVSVSNRCKGLYLNILGDLIIEGTLSMSSRGAKGVGTNIGIIPDIGIFYSDNMNYLINMGCLEKNIIPAVGAATNTAGVNRQTGGRRQWRTELVIEVVALEHQGLVFLEDLVVVALVMKMLEGPLAHMQGLADEELVVLMAEVVEEQETQVVVDLLAQEKLELVVLLY